MSDSNTILPTAQINGLEQGLDHELAALEAALDSQIYLENLPIIGTQLGAAFKQGQAALTKISVLEANVKQALTNLNNLPNATLGNLQTAINGAVSSAGFANTVLTSLDGGSLTLKFANSASTTFNETLGGNFGLPGLNFDTSGSAQTTVGYNLNLNATVDASGSNFSISTPGPAPALSLTLGVKAPTFTASASLGSSDATLGFLKFNAADKGSNLQGTFGIDTSGNAEFTGSAHLDVALGSNMGSAALPSVSAELVGDWSFGNSPVAANNQATFGDAPSISLENVKYDFGSFVNKFIEPILNEIAPILQPIEQALSVFDTPLDFLGGGTIDNGNDGLLGTLWHQLDVAGAVNASGSDIPDGEITLVDLLKLATGANLAPMVNFLTTVTDIVQWATALSGSNVGSALTYNLGSFSIPNDIRAANFDISQIAPVITGAQDLPTFLAGLSNPPAPGAPLTAAQALQALLNPTGSSLLSFPIISNPASALQFLLGGTADLFDANFLVTPVSFGSIDPATGNPTSLVNLLPPINLSPIPLVNFDLTLQAALQATVGLNFGYDTSGLTAFKNGNFADPSKILNGLFVEDPIQNGVTEPVAQISGAVQLGVEASAILASIGGGGNIGGSLSLSFSQPGKNYLNILANKISNQGALSIFDASGRVTAGFQAVVKALGSSLWTYNSPRITLATFDTGAGKAGSGKPNATTWIGPVGGDFETPANWNPTFANIKNTVYYGDATIGQNTTVTFAGQLPADLASLSLGTGSLVNLTKGTFTIDGTSIDSINSGTIAVNGAAHLVVSGSVKNVGAITVGFATGPGGVLAPVITAAGLMQLYGGGNVILSDATTNHWLGTATKTSAPLLWNLDNTISGAGTINLPMLNQGVMNANGTKLLVLTGGAITNQGLLEATGNDKGAGVARTGGLSILSTVQNGGGTIAAHSNGDVVFQNGITINGGMLQTSSPADGSIITTAGQVTLDGGATGLTIAGNVAAGTGSTLTLTGLINSAPYSTTLGQSAVSSGKGTVLLQGATIKDGELNAITAGGSIKVSGTATLDGSDGAGSLALDGLVHVSSGNTLVVAGSVNPGKDGGGIELTAGTLLIGNATTDAATFAPSLAGSVAGTGGSLLLDDVAGNVVTGADVGSSLTNSWTIRGSGQLGNGQLAIINATKGVIEATGANALVVRGGGPVINAGLIEAGQIGGTGGTLDLQSSVANAGGTIAADGGTTYLDGATTALTIGGGVLATSSGGVIMALGNATLDGTASKVTIASAAAVTAGSGATLTLTGSVTNNGFLAAVAGGALDLQGTLANAANGSISTFGGAARLDGVTLSGGSLLNAPGDHFEVVADSLMDAVTLVPGALVVVDAGRALTLKGSIVDHGTISLTGNSGAASTAALKIAGLVALSGGGTISLADASGSSNAQLITGAATGATLDNVHGTISGYGKVGAGDTKLTLNNKLGSVVNATSGGGSLNINTGTNAITNLGLLEASAGGVLDVHSNVTNAGGTIAGNAGTVELDVMTVSGGIITTTAGGVVDVAGSATLNGVATAVTIAAGAQLAVGGKDTLTLKGTIVDAGVLSVTGTSSASANAELLVSGTVALTGGGVLSLQDANGTSPNSQIVVGTTSSDVLDNVIGTISGYGRLGAGLMTLKNEATGIINAMFGTLAVYTGTNSIANAGLLEATTGILDLRSNVNNVGVKSTIGAVAGGTTELDQITVTGGSFTSATGGKIAVVNTATLDGTTNAITLQSSAQLGVGGGSTLTLKGSIVDQGLLSVVGNGASAAKLLVSGAVALSGTGTVTLSNSGGPAAFASETITSVPTGGTLDHLGGMIFGYGEIVGAKLALTNEKGATVEAAGGNLVISTGTAVSNLGLLAAFGGDLLLQSPVTNGGIIMAEAAGVVSVQTTVTNTGLVSALNSGIVLVQGSITGPTGTVTIAAGGMIELDHGTLNGGTLNNAAKGTVEVTTNGGTLANISVVNAGVVTLVGNSSLSQTSALHIVGSVQLTGGGLVSLSDASGSAMASSQVITGTVASDTLDNFDNTISGYGQLGNGLMTLENETSATIDAVGGTLVVNTGTNTVINTGLLEAATSSVLDLRSDITNTSGTIDANGGAVDLDRMTVIGGTLTTENGGTIHVTGSAALAGIAGPITLALASHLEVDNGQTLTLEGTIVNQGTLSIVGNGGGFTNHVPNSTAFLDVSGTATLSGGGTLSLFDGSGFGLPVTEVVTGTVAGDTLDNFDNTISGYGQLGNGLMTLKNEASGMIKAAGNTLTVDTGKNTITNKGLLEATTSILQLNSGVANVGGTISAQGNLVDLDGITVSGGLLQTSGANTIQVIGAGALDGTTAVTLASGGQLVIGGGDKLTLNGSIINHGTMSLGGNGGAFVNKAPNSIATLRVAGAVTLSGGGLVSLSDASGFGLAVTQVITGTVAGDTLENVDNTISGYGQLGNGLMILENDAGGTINANGGSLVVDTGKNTVVNNHLIEATSGVLDLRSNVSNAGATIAAVAAPVQLDGITVSGGTLSSSAGGSFQVIGAATLDGTTTAVTLALGTQLAVASGDTLTLKGSIANHGTVALIGSGAGFINKVPNSSATLRVGGTVALSGGGTVSLFDGSGFGLPVTQVVTGTVAGDTLDNIDNTISGYAQLGNGLMTLKNEAQGTIEATGGTLTVDTSKNSIVNIGLLEGVGGALQVKSAVTNSGTITTGSGGSVDLNAAVANTGVVSAAAGGTITLRAALSGATSITNVAAGSTLVLDGGVLQGGTVSNAAKGSINVTTNDGALKTIAVVNAGVLSVIGNGGGFNNNVPNSVATLHVGGVVTLSGGGTVSLFDGSGFGLPATEVITGTVAGDTLDNIDNTISGYGQLGNGLMTLKNEAKGTINATGGILTVDTGKNSIINKHLLEATSGVLDLRSNVSNAAATITAAGAIVMLDGMTVSGGTLTSTGGGAIQVIGTATLAGTATAITLATGMQLAVANGDTLLVNGGIINQGTVGIAGSGAGIINKLPNSVATLRVGGVVKLSGGGTVSLSDASGFGLSPSQVITGTVAGDTLDNIDNTISGYAQLGNGLMTLKNEAKGTIDATGGTLTVDTGKNSIVNIGLLEGVSGALQVQSAVTNSGTITTGSGGRVELNAAVANTGVVSAAGGGTITLRAALSGATSITNVAAGSTLVLDGGVLQGGTVSNAATGSINVTTNGGALQTIAVVNAGVLSVIGNGGGFNNNVPNSVATLHVGGVVTLSGGGTVSLFDGSGFGLTATQVITGTVAGDTLDNVDNTISGYGLLGNGLMTLKNEIKGTINATGGILVVDTGKNSVVNKHLLEATSGVLDLRSNVSNAAATITAAGAIVKLDGMTVSGGTVSSTAGGAIQVIGTATLDGTTTAVTLATATQLAVASGDTLVLNGSIISQGTVSIAGNGAGIINKLPNSVATLRVGGVVTLSGGGTISLSDVSGFGLAVSQVITGTVAGDTLDNIDNTISGYGLLGNGLMTLKNEVKGTINATGGILTVDTGNNSIVNKHLIEATSGVLDLRSNVTNAGGTIAGTGATVELDGMTVSGGTLSNSGGGAIQVIGTATLDGTATAVTLTAGTQLAVGDGNTLILKGSIADQGAITDAGTVINNNALSGSITISGSGQFSNIAGAKATGAVTATAGGETIANLGTVTGAVTLAGGDLLITGAGAVFTGGIKDNGGNNALEIAKGPYTLTKFDAAGTAQYTSLQIDAGVNVTTDATDIFTGVAVDNLGTLNAVAFKITNTLLNSGVINGDVGLASGATLNNLAGGTISGSGLAAIAGSNGPATVVNAGLIDPGTFGINLPGGGSVTNLAGGVIEGASTGVNISGGAGIVTNAGTISGGGIDSVILASGFTNRVVVDPGARFIGVVDGGNKAGSGADSTLEFAAGAGGTKLSGLGTAFINFATLSIDSGALISLQGSNTIAAISNAGTLDASSGTETLTAPLITAPSGSSGVLEIDASGDLVVNAGSVDATQSVMFTDGTGTLTIGTLSGFAATIGSAATGDEIIVQGKSIASTSFNAASHVLSLLNASKGVIGTLKLAPSVLGSGFKADGKGGITLVDTTAPAAPSMPDLLAASDSGVSATDNITSLTTPAFTGTAEANSKVTLFDGTTAVGTGKASATGAWSITSSTLAQGAHSITAKATDLSGNIGVASGVLHVTIDTTAPAAPGKPDLAAASDSGSSNTDNMTKVTTPVFTGTAEANATVALFDGATALGSGKASAAGVWSITSGALGEGTHTITAKATDQAGNVGVASGALSVTIDTSAPAAPSTPDLVATSDSGISSTDGITKVTTPVFSGTAEPNSAITLFNGAIVAGAAQADSGGHWTVTSSALAQGTHAMTAKAIDVAGNTGPASAVLSITIDTTAPAAPSAPDLAAASDSGASHTDNFTDVATPLFTGTAAANSLVTLFDGATAVGSGNASAGGAWSITSSVLAPGTHSVTATAADTAGNLSPASKALSITINPTAPVSASTIGLASSPNFMAVPGSKWTGSLVGHWEFGDIATGLNAAAAQMFSSGGVMDTATTGAGVMTATDWAGTATVNSTAAHLWGGNDNHDGWQVPLVGH